MKRHALFYTLLAVFLLTCMVTLGGVVGWFHIDPLYLKLLVSSFLIELAVALYGVVKKVDFFADETPKPAIQQAQSPVARPIPIRQRQLDEALAQVKQLQTELDTARKAIGQLQVLAARAKPLPVVASFRRAAFGDGYVLQIKRKSIGTFPLTIKVSNATFKKSAVFTKTLTDDQILEIGHMEGWDFFSGDDIEVSNAQYDAMRVSPS